MGDILLRAHAFLPVSFAAKRTNSWTHWSKCAESVRSDLAMIGANARRFLLAQNIQPNETGTQSKIADTLHHRERVSDHLRGMANAWAGAKVSTNNTSFLAYSWDTPVAILNDHAVTE